MAASTKERLIRTTATKLAISERIIEAVVNHQFQSANEATDLNTSVELAGFGKFVLNVNKAKKRVALLEKYIEEHNKQLQLPERTKSEKFLNALIKRAEEEIASIKPIIHEL